MTKTNLEVAGCLKALEESRLVERVGLDGERRLDTSVVVGHLGCSRVERE